MNENHEKLMQKSLFWLKEKVFPLWLSVGVDPAQGLFIENLSLDGKAQSSPKRAMVQARQIYAFVEGMRLSVLDKEAARQLVKNSALCFIKSYALPNGSFVHSIGTDGQHSNMDVDLYTQAFALFGLAQAYEVSGLQDFKEAALKLLGYLSKERRAPAGGYTEIKNQKALFQSNPHMHLFEAAIAWMKIDADPVWRELALELHDLCVHQFIDSSTGLLAEHFDEKWRPLREDGRFIFEPGHHYEWSWLFIQYRQLVQGRNDYSRKLFDHAENLGLSENGELAFDEVWSDGEVRKRSSRFWPQSERIKAAVVLGEASVADRALSSLMKNFLLMEQGLWKDTLLETGGYGDQPVKASSLYHIINAISEYVAHRARVSA